MEIEDMLEQMFGCKINEKNGKNEKPKSYKHSHSCNHSFNKNLINEIYTFVRSKNPYKLSQLKSGNYAITLNSEIVDKLYCDDLIEAKYEYIIKIMEL